MITWEACKKEKAWRESIVPNLESGFKGSISLNYINEIIEIITTVVHKIELDNQSFDCVFSGAVMKLPFIRERVSDILEKRERVKSNLLGILLYPMVILIVSFAVIAFMISVVVPKIVKIYLTMKVQLPLSTRAVIWLSNSFIEHKVFFAVLLIVIFWLMYVLRAKYKNVYDLVKVKLPIFGTVFLNSSLQRFFETLFILLHSGIPLVQSLDIAKATLDNKYLEVIVSDIKDKVEEGSSLYDSIRNSGREIFPDISLQLIKAGENSGNLEQSLQKLSDIFEEEIENFSKYLTSILEPITIVLVGTIIGFIVFSLLLPIAQISTLR